MYLHNSLFTEHDKLKIIGISEGCDQNGDRSSKSDKSCHIFSMRLKGILDNLKNMGLCLYIYMMYKKAYNILETGHD